MKPKCLSCGASMRAVYRRSGLRVLLAYMLVLGGIIMGLTVIGLIPGAIALVLGLLIYPRGQKLWKCPKCGMAAAR